ncbi:hypothetical protein [Phenylobacterium sp.]|jgi:hypothetical protein|uniref:hypothetical protein n=1 Tax=Phenylobacterium sp. TaxID=1871053 RepID=UPI0035AF1579
MSDKDTDHLEAVEAAFDPWAAASSLQDVTSREAVAWPLRPGILTIPVDAHLRAFTGGSLVRAALLQTFTVTGTVAPGPRCVHYMVPTAASAVMHTLFPYAEVHEEESGCRLLLDLKAWSQLTYEEIAPLLGVSRRTLHSWNSGNPISARRETRLRKVTEVVKALHSIALAQGRPVRSALLDATPEGLRPYDLIADGHNQAAIDAVSGHRTQIAAPVRPEQDSVATQLNRGDDAVSVPAGPLRSDMARRIR